MKALKGKQRPHTSKHYSNGTIDQYPAIDVFIPEAVAEANKQFPKQTTSIQWTVCFCDCMDELLFKAGLRVV